MFTPLHAILFGILRGLTEYFPISYTAHLILLKHILSIDDPPVEIDIVLQFGALCALLFVLRKPVWRVTKAIPRMPKFFLLWFQKGHLAIGDDPDVWLSLLISVTTIVSVVISGLFYDQFHESFSSLRTASLGLIITGILLFSTRVSKKVKGKTATQTTLQDALIIGLGRGCAVLPGLSRPAITVSSSLLLGLERTTAAEFAYLLSMPVFLGNVLVESFHSWNHEHLPFTTLTIGFASAFFVGIFALKMA